MPMQAASQVQAALVSPRTLKCRAACTMTPAPRKPIPVRIPCITRLPASETILASSEWTITSSMAVARLTSDSVFNPIGLPCRSRLRPIKPPASVATPRRNMISVQSSNAIVPGPAQPCFGNRPIM